jgi:hypothetical protein
VAKHRPLLVRQKDACQRGYNETFVMIDSVAAVLGLVSAGIFLAHAIESYRAHASVGAEARFTSFKQGMFCSDVFSECVPASKS